MEAREQAAMAAENDYLKARCAQLQGDVADLSAELQRARQQLDHAYARRSAPQRPDPLSGGQ